MSTIQRLTLIGMYDYDSTLFDNVTLPEGYVKQDFIDALLLEHGEKCVMYTDVDFTKYSLGVVSRKWFNELERLYTALTAEYNPVHNFDRYEDYEDHSGTTYGKKTEADYSNTTTYNTTDTAAQTVDSNNERKVSAYNSTAYEPDEKTTSNAGTMSTERHGTDTLATKGTMESASGTDKTNSSHKGHLYGNIGVTSSEQLINQEIELRTKSNLYELAARIFANELLIQIY